MTKIVICDDEKIIVNQLQSYVENVFAQQKRPCEIQTFTQPMDLLPVLQNSQTDILLLDIDMPSINGMDIAAQLRKQIHQQNYPFAGNQTVGESKERISGRTGGHENPAAIIRYFVL